MLFFPYKPLWEWLQHNSNQHLVKILLNVFIVRLEAARQVRLKDSRPKSRKVFVCRQGLCPCLLQNENSLHSTQKPPQIHGICLCQWPLAKSWICQNKLLKANAPILIDNLLISFLISVKYRFHIKFTVIIQPVYVIKNTFIAIKKTGENTLTFPVSIHRETT